HDVREGSLGLAVDRRRGGAGMTYIARSPMIAARRLGDEMIVMSAADSSLFTLNDVAATIFEAADGTTSLQAIVALRVLPEFEIDEQQAMHDAMEFVQQLSQHGILLVSEQPIAPAGGAR